ncbi:MAG: nuclear transport factor 2 family protein [Bacteroidota bacterium]
MNLSARTSSTVLSILFLCLFIGFHATSVAQDMEVKDDRQLIIEAMEDYVLALYNVEPERIARSVDTTLHKVGYYDYKEKSYYNKVMTYQQLYDLSARWNKTGESANENSPKMIDIYEIHDKTAAAKLTAEWGIDFMHLYKINGRWMIKNIMWQGPPK